MGSASKLTCQMTMITHSIFAEFLVTDVTKSRVVINQFIMHCHYPTFWELKLFINIFDILFKCVYKYLCNIVIFKFFYKNNRFLRIVCIIKTLYVVTKSAWGVFLIPLGVAVIRVWLTCWQLWCEGFKICICYKWNPQWSIVIFKTNFRFLFRKFNLIPSCDLQYSWWDTNDFSVLKVLRHKNTHG